MLDVTLIASVVGVLIPLVVAASTKLHASGTLKTGLAVLLAALSAVATWATSITGKVSVKELITEALVALAVAGGSRVSWVGTFESKVAVATADTGLGTQTKVDPDYPAAPVG